MLKRTCQFLQQHAARPARQCRDCLRCHHHESGSAARGVQRSGSSAQLAVIPAGVQHMGLWRRRRRRLSAVPAHTGRLARARSSGLLALHCTLLAHAQETCSDCKATVPRLRGHSPGYLAAARRGASRAALSDGPQNRFLDVILKPSSAFLADACWPGAARQLSAHTHLCRLTTRAALAAPRLRPAS